MHMTYPVHGTQLYNYPNMPLRKPGLDDSFFSASATRARALESLSLMVVR